MPHIYCWQQVVHPCPISTADSRQLINALYLLIIAGTSSVPKSIPIAGSLSMPYICCRLQTFHQRLSCTFHRLSKLRQFQHLISLKKGFSQFCIKSAYAPKKEPTTDISKEVKTILYSPYFVKITQRLNSIPHLIT